MSHHDYSELVILFEDFLAEQVITNEPASLYEPIKYMNRIGGKRIRPVLVLMAYNLWNDDIKPALQPALAVEYFHNFTLMHDDIMDEALLRRGQQSVHARFGNNAAILSGDAMLIKSFQYLINFETTHNLQSSITNLMANVSLEICEGQQMDMDFESLPSVSLLEYIEMIRKKTACLFGACLQMGGMLSNNSDDSSAALYKCGENFGIAFQIWDDILDVFGNSTLTGKVQGGDIIRGKKNFLYVQAINSLIGQEREDFISSYANVSVQNLDAILNVYKKLEIENFAREQQLHYFNMGMQSLQNLPVDTTVLQKFASRLITRDH